MTETPHASRFDAAYYRRFYGRSGVHDADRIAQLATGVCALAAWWKVTVRTVLDVGAGPGYWARWFAANRRNVRYHGIDVSPHACERHGHELADIATWRPRRRYDLVVCQSVLQYLGDREAAAAIGTLGEASRGLLYLEVPTLGDRDGAIDPDGTDLDVHWRTGQWYRTRLRAHFTEIGGGLWLSHDHPSVLFELERAR